jgi:hypothetical protein
MKKYLLLISSTLLTGMLSAQNTFPSSGNVGIGNTSPVAALSFTDVDATTSPTGITWYSAGGVNNATAYGIHKTAGSWTSPDYQQLRLGWNTGIVLDPGTQYGKSYVDITGNGLRVTNGSVGIGTTTPQFKLDVEAPITRIKNSSSASAAYTSFRVQGAEFANGLEIDFFGQSNIPSIEWSYGAGVGGAAIVNVNAKPLVFGTANAGRMIIDGAGNVGIGTTKVNDANYKLFVETGIRTRKVKVDVSTWADYVFSSSYKLPTLKEVENFIKQHKHLPNVPSEAEVKKEGLDLGENQALLLKKIEELTLYIIEQNKKIESQQSEITNLKDQNKELQDLKRDLKIIKAKLQN